MGPDGRTLYVAVAADDSAAPTGDGSTVVALDAATFEVLDTWRLAGAVSGLGVSSDGASVYAAVGARVTILDATSGLEVGQVPLPTDQTVVRVTPLAS